MVVSGMSEFALSIVCTTYNCHQFIEHTIASLIAGANRPDIEVLFVDDCSADGSASHCRQILQARAAEISFNWHVHSYETNQGVSVCRNYGIAQSRGAYIAFLDGDDVIAGNYAQTIIPAIQSGAPQVLEFSYSEIGETDAAPMPADQSPAEQPVIFKGSSRYKTLYKYGFFVWMRVYRQDIIKPIQFIEDGRAYEDVAFIIDLFAQVDAIHRMNVSLVGYRRRQGSITASRNLRFLDQLTQLNQAMQRNREGFNGGLMLEITHLRKLVIILLKGIRIRPKQDRVVFYRCAIQELRPQRPLVSNISILPSKLFSGFMLGIAKLQTIQPS